MECLDCRSAGRQAQHPKGRGYEYMITVRAALVATPRIIEGGGSPSCAISAAAVVTAERSRQDRLAIWPLYLWPDVMYVRNRSRAYATAAIINSCY